MQCHHRLDGPKLLSRLASNCRTHLRPFALLVSLLHILMIGHGAFPPRLVCDPDIGWGPNSDRTATLLMLIGPSHHLAPPPLAFFLIVLEPGTHWLILSWSQAQKDPQQHHQRHDFGSEENGFSRFDKGWL